MGWILLCHDGKAVVELLWTQERKFTFHRRKKASNTWLTARLISFQEAPCSIFLMPYRLLNQLLSTHNITRDVVLLFINTFILKQGRARSALVCWTNYDSAGRESFDDSGRTLAKYIIGNHAGKKLNLSQQSRMAASKSTMLMPSFRVLTSPVWMTNRTCLWQ
jgi:hypothetical protein